jgi:Flp pilus assembly protein TadD
MAAKNASRRREKRSDRRHDGRSPSARLGDIAPDGAPATDATPRRFSLALGPPAVVAALAVLVYLPALSGKFIWDDQATVLDNPLLRDWHGLLQIWTRFGAIPKEEHWWPLTYTLFWLEYQAFGLWTPGYHVVNFALHATIAAWIGRLLSRAKIPGAWLAAALFAVHPAHVEAVAWVTSAKDLLASVFYLWAAECFLNREERGGWKWPVAAALAIALGMLCKSMVATLPAGLAILIWHRRGRLARRDWLALAPMAAAIAFMTGLDSVARRLNPQDFSFTAPPLMHRVLQAGWAFWSYAGKLAWPASLSCIYPQWEIDPAKPAHWLPLIGVAAVTVALWLSRRRLGRGAFACWAYYGSALSPMLGVVSFIFLTKTPVADRYQYLASIGPLAGAGALMAQWMGRREGRSRVLRALPAGVVLVVLGVLTWRQASLYRNQELLFRHAVEISPRSALAYCNLGDGLFRNGHVKEACLALETATRIRPNYVQAYDNLGIALLEDKRVEEARVATERVIQLDPSNVKAIERLGSIDAMQGKLREMIDLFRWAIASGHQSPELVSKLAMTLATQPDAQMRNPAEALALAKRAVELGGKPNPYYLCSLAAALAASGRQKEAATVARQALGLARQQKKAQLANFIEKTIPIYERGGALVLPSSGAP